MLKAKHSNVSLPEPPNWKLIKEDLARITDSDPFFVNSHKENVAKEVPSREICKYILKLQTSSNVLANTCKMLQDIADSLVTSMQRIDLAVNEVESQLKNALQQ